MLARPQAGPAKGQATSPQCL